MLDATIWQAGPGTALQVTWAAAARAVIDWVGQHALELRDVVVLVPYENLLVPARQAFACHAGWQPRIETVRTLAQGLGPVRSDGAGPSLDASIDRLEMASLLRQQPFGRDWERRDRRGFELAVQSTVDAAQALAVAATAKPPGERAAYWTLVRERTPLPAGPGALEGALLRVAVAWAAAAGRQRTDQVFDHQASAWVLVRTGINDRLTEAVVEAAPPAAPRLLINLGPGPGQPLDASAHGPTPVVLHCDDMVSEALCAAANVIDALNAGQVPVALIALDRSLVRRVRALLERAGVQVVDETGWRLSTTRAGARLMAWLRAASPGAQADDRLDWLKGWPPALTMPAELNRLEALWRRPQRRFDTAAVVAAEALWARAESSLAWATLAGERTLAGWLDALRQALEASGEWTLLVADEAGAAVLSALRLQQDLDPRWQALAQDRRLSLPGFVAWVDAELEGGRFIPAAAAADVHLVPLLSTVMRPFGAVVMPGADARHLGQVEASQGLIGEALAAELGLPTMNERRLNERLAFAHLFRQPRLVISRRRQDGDEPLAASPDLLAWLLARSAGIGHVAADEAWQPLVLPVAPSPIMPPLPVAAQGLPASLSASQVEALRACPYQFFARAVLGLQQDDELDRGVEKRDYGTWLHAVLHRFHRDRPTATADLTEQLAAAAQAELDDAAFDRADLLPFQASFEVFAPAYLNWMQGVEQAGWSWLSGETSYRIQPAFLAPTGLHGRIDRVDQSTQGLRLIDYKTGSAASLLGRMKPRTEDTQLAFYAALVLAQGGQAPMEAGYLTLDDADAPRWLLHEQVAISAQILVEQLGGELRRLRAGAPMPALGEGATCDYCDMRGLCRRDHWCDQETTK